jgi:hypothetical protein
MATAVTNLTQYFLQGAIEAFANRLAPISAIAYAVNQDGAVMDDIIKIPYINCVTSSNDFSYTTGYNTSGDTIVGKNVTLSNLKYKMVALDDKMYVQTGPEVLTKLGSGMGAMLAYDVLSTVLLCVTASNYAGSGSASGTTFNTQSNIVALATTANTDKWPDTRALIVNPAVYGAIMNSTTLNSYSTFQSVVTENKVPRVSGFNLFLTNAIPTNSEGLSAFALTPSSILLGMAYHAPNNGVRYVSSQMVKDNVTGLVLGMRSLDSQILTTMSHVVDCLFSPGTVGNSAGLIRISN